jgi:hypothetical protein
MQLKTAISPHNNNAAEEFGTTGTNFRASSKDLKPTQSIKIIPNPSGNNFQSIQSIKK